MFLRLPAGDHLDRTLALMGILGSILLTVFVTLRIGRVVYILVGILTFLACLTWLFLRERDHGRFQPSLSPPHSNLLAASFFLLMIVGEAVLYARPLQYERPLPYFLILALAAGLIAVQILMSERPSPGIVLIQVIILGLSIAWSQLLIFPNLVGIDPWYHEFFTLKIFSNHMIPHDQEYSSLPVFHLLIGTLSLFTGLSYKLAAILSVSLVQVMVDCSMLYLMGRYLISSSRAGLMASLMAVIANEHIFMSFWSIPNAFAAIFIPAILYLLWRTGTGTPRIIRAILLAIPMAALILTHSLSSMCMGLVLIAVWGAYVLSRRLYPEMITSKQSPVPLVVPVLFFTGMFGWWYFGTTLVQTLTELISLGFSADVFDNTPLTLITRQAPVSVAEQIFNFQGLYLFFALSFIGIFYLISTRRDHRVALVMAGITPLMVGFISLLAGYAVLYERWWFFSQILLAVPVGVGVMVFCSRITRGSPRFTALVTLFMVSALTFLLIMSPQADVDNHLFSKNTTTTASLTESELASMQTVFSHDTSLIRTDEYFSGSQQYIPGIWIEPFGANLISGVFEGHPSETMLIRDAILNKPFMVYSRLFTLDYNLEDRLDQFGFSRIYDAGTVQGYRR